MQVTDLQIEDQERAHASLECMRRSELPYFSYDGSGRLKSPEMRISLGRQLVTMNERFPFLLSDFDNVAGLLERIQLDEMCRVVFVCSHVEGKNCNLDQAETFLEKTKEYKVGSSLYRGKLLSENVCMLVGPYRIEVIKKIFADTESIGAPTIVDPEALYQRWLKSIASEVDSRVVKAIRRIRDAEQELVNRNREAGPAILVQRLVHQHGMNYIKDQVVEISKLPNVISATPKGLSHLIVVTGPTCSDAVILHGKRYPAKYTGRWEILCDFTTGMVKARNIASPTKSFQCLHHSRYDDGQPNSDRRTCMGGYQSAMSTCLRELNYPGLISNAIEYLRTCTIEDGRGASNFDKLPDSIEPPAKPHKFETWINLLNDPNRED